MARANIDSLYPATLSPMSSSDIVMRHAYGGNDKAILYSRRYGLLRDDSRLAESIEGPAQRMAGPSSYARTGSGSVRLKRFSGGDTPSNPGGHNWGTLSGAVDAGAGAIAELYNFGAEMRETSSGKLDYSDPTKRNTGFRFKRTPIYNSFRGKKMTLSLDRDILNKKVPGAAPSNEPMSLVPAGPIPQWTNTPPGFKTTGISSSYPRVYGASSPYPKPTDVNESVQKFIGDMRRDAEGRAQNQRLSPSQLYNANKSMRSNFPNFYLNNP